MLFHPTLIEKHWKVSVLLFPLEKKEYNYCIGADEIWKMSVEKNHCVIPSRNPLPCGNLKGSNLSKNRLALVDISPAFGPNLPCLIM